MANQRNQSPLSGGSLPPTVASVLDAAERGSRGEGFAGSVPPVEDEDLDRMAPDAVREPLERILMGDVPDAALVYLCRTPVLRKVLPEVTGMVDFKDEYARHKDLWTHTIKVVAQVEPKAELRWAALLHDVGKVATRSIESDGRVHFFGHEVAGARMFRRIGRRLAFASGPFDRIHFLIRNHLRPGQYEPGWTDSAVRRFGREMGDALADLVALSRADITTRFEVRKSRNRMLLDELLARVDDIQGKDAVPKALPKGLGNVIMERFGIAPGPRLGRIISRLQEQVETGALVRGGDHTFYIGILESRPDLLE